jgi:hypothetical protein
MYRHGKSSVGRIILVLTLEPFVWRTKLTIRQICERKFSGKAQPCWKRVGKVPDAKAKPAARQAAEPHCPSQLQYRGVRSPSGGVAQRERSRMARLARPRWLTFSRREFDRQLQDLCYGSASTPPHACDPTLPNQSPKDRLCLAQVAATDRLAGRPKHD